MMMKQKLYTFVGPSILLGLLLAAAVELRSAMSEGSSGIHVSCTAQRYCRRSNQTPHLLSLGSQ